MATGTNGIASWKNIYSKASVGPNTDQCPTSSQVLAQNNIELVGKYNSDQLVRYDDVIKYTTVSNFYPQVELSSTAGIPVNQVVGSGGNKLRIQLSPFSNVAEYNYLNSIYATTTGISWTATGNTITFSNVVSGVRVRLYSLTENGSAANWVTYANQVYGVFVILTVTYSYQGETLYAAGGPTGTPLNTSPMYPYDGNTDIYCYFPNGPILHTGGPFTMIASISIGAPHSISS